MSDAREERPRVLALGEIAPRIAPDAWVAGGATVVGDVTVGARSNVWYGAVLRADTERVMVGEDCNLQDGCVLHSDPGQPVVIGDRVTVGHRAIVHAAVLESDTLIGMGAIVLNGARVGTGSLVAAGAVVRAGSEIEAGSMVAGVPAVARRPVSEQEWRTILQTPGEYVAKADRHREARPSGDRPDGAGTAP